MCDQKRHFITLMIPYEELTIGERIGGGATSVVYKGFWKKCPIVIKKWFDPKCDKQIFEEFNTELITYSELRHPNITQFLGACARPPELCIIMEYLPLSLHDLLHCSMTELSLKRILGFSLDICHAMIYLHDQKPPIIHRDLKPSNFLVDRAWCVKLCDMGLASNLKSQRHAGTIMYMAPELLTSGDSNFNEKVDVYAFGVLLNEMITRKLPFDGLSVHDIKNRILNHERPELSLSCDNTVQKVITECWTHDPHQRPCFTDVHDALDERFKAL